MALSRRIVMAQLLLAVGGTVPGCAWLRSVCGPRDPFAASAPCRLAADASVVEVVEYLNANTSRIAAWRSDNVTILGRGAAKTPVKVDANLAIESPRNFRLTARTMAGEEVDLGSNQDEYWFWNRRSEQKHVFVNYHDQEPNVQRRLPIPFQPDWVMEAFGVMPIDPTGVEVQHGPPGSHTLYLIADRMSPDGRPVRKITTVDACHGVVREHSLYDEQGERIATARIIRHVIDPGTGAVLPAQIDLDWPRADIGLTMWINRIEVNPPNIPEGIWRKPTKEGYPEYQLGARPASDVGAAAVSAR